jgi:hypothetical protein
MIFYGIKRKPRRNESRRKGKEFSEKYFSSQLFFPPSSHENTRRLGGVRKCVCGARAKATLFIINFPAGETTEKRNRKEREENFMFVYENFSHFIFLCCHPPSPLMYLNVC